jgi:hypothetical protein
MLKTRLRRKLWINGVGLTSWRYSPMSDFCKQRIKLISVKKCNEMENLKSNKALTHSIAVYWFGISVERSQQHCLYWLDSHTVWLITSCLCAILSQFNQAVIILALVWEMPFANLYLIRPWCRGRQSDSLRPGSQKDGSSCNRTESPRGHPTACQMVIGSLYWG